MNALQIAMIMLSVSLNAGSQLLLRKAMIVAGPLPPLSQPVKLAGTLAFNMWLVSGLACCVLGVAAWLVVLSRTEVSIAYPMLSIGYVIAAVIGVACLGEQVTIMRMCGIALICLGVVVVAQTA